MQELLQTGLNYAWMAIVGIAILVIGFVVLVFVVSFVQALFSNDNDSSNSGESSYGEGGNSTAEDIKILEERTIPSMARHFSTYNLTHEEVIHEIISHLRQSDIDLIRKYYPDEYYLIADIVRNNSMHNATYNY